MLNKAEKAVEQHKLDQEKAVLRKLELHYEYALKGINERLRVLQAAPETQSKVYQKQYQETLKKQVSAILENLHANEYSTLDQYMHDAYTTGFVGTMYDLHYQDVPLLIPINQDAILKAVQHDTKLTHPLYDELGIDTKRMSRFISRELSRGLASGLTYDEVARNIKNVTRAPLSRAKTIARTEGHRIHEQSSQDAAIAAKEKGADLVKQWDATLDGDTRPNHRQLDGQIRELDKSFEVGSYSPMHPGDFGEASEDCNCRCVSLKRARTALDEDELKILRERAVLHSLYADDPKAFRQGKLPALKNYEEFQKSYLKAAENPANTTKTLKSQGESGIMKERNIAQRSMSNGLRTSPYHILTDEEINSVLEDAKALNIPASVLRFNEKNRTGFYDAENLIYIRGDILPDTQSTNLRDNLSQRAALAHEYYGHYLSHPSKFEMDDWRDEFQASYKAAVNAPNLTDMERRMLMLDAYDRAKEAGVRVIYNKKARELIYGFD